MSQDTKVCDELVHLPSSENKGIVSIDTGSTDPSVTHVGVALSRPDLNPKKLNPVSCVLQTAKVRAKGHCVTATVYFDTGSDRSYVASSLVKKVRPKWMCSEPITYSVFGSKTSKDHICNLFD